MLAGDPLRLIDDVDDGDENPVSAGVAATPFPITMSQFNVLAAAPFFQAGVTIVTSAGAAPLTVCRIPDESNDNVPDPSDVGVPRTPPANSPPSTLRS